MDPGLIPEVEMRSGSVRTLSLSRPTDLTSSPECPCLTAQVDYEERELEAAHPDTFPPYRERVKKFIPFIF